VKRGLETTHHRVLHLDLPPLRWSESGDALVAVAGRRSRADRLENAPGIGEKEHLSTGWKNPPPWNVETLKISASHQGRLWNCETGSPKENSPVPTRKKRAVKPKSTAS
jgi:hypothetical protein